MMDVVHQSTLSQKCVEDFMSALKGPKGILTALCAWPCQALDVSFIMLLLCNLMAPERDCIVYRRRSVSERGQQTP